MLRKLEQEGVTLLVAASLQIDKDVIIPPGQYVAVAQRFITKNIHTPGRPISRPVYLMELTGEQLITFGSDQLGDYASIEFDVTEHVRRGTMVLMTAERRTPPR